MSNYVHEGTPERVKYAIFSVVWDKQGGKLLLYPIRHSHHRYKDIFKYFTSNCRSDTDKNEVWGTNGVNSVLT